MKIFWLFPKFNFDFEMANLHKLMWAAEMATLPLGSVLAGHLEAPPEQLCTRRHRENSR